MEVMEHSNEETEERLEAIFRSLGAATPNEQCDPLVYQIMALLPPSSSIAAIERNGVGRPQTLLDAPPRSLDSIETWAKKLAVLNSTCKSAPPDRRRMLTTATAMRERFPDLSERRQAACMMNHELLRTLMCCLPRVARAAANLTRTSSEARTLAHSALRTQRALQPEAVALCRQRHDLAGRRHRQCRQRAAARWWWWYARYSLSLRGTLLLNAPLNDSRVPPQSAERSTQSPGLNSSSRVCRLARSKPHKRS